MNHVLEFMGEEKCFYEMADNPVRFEKLFDQLTESFGDADHVIVTDIYAAREEPMPGVNGGELANKIKGSDVRYVPDFEELVKELVTSVKPNSVVLTLSAGDANRVGQLVLQELSEGAGEGEGEGQGGSHV